MGGALRIALLEPYDTGSHGAWLRGYAANSRHLVLPLTLPGQFWKWRMYGGAVTLAAQLAQVDPAPDCLLATDMLDLTTLLALSRRRCPGIPVALYMHENQLTYPLRPTDKRELHYGFINFASMLCADVVFFNSAYHLDAWFDELPHLLKHFPDYNELEAIPGLRAKSRVLPLGLDLRGLDPPEADPLKHRARTGPPVILWNHRWEYDKAPEVFLRALYALQALGLDFRVVFLGESFVRVPDAFAEARARLGERILQFGWVDVRVDYARWLWRSDLVVSTALHDFFGASVVEAMSCGCYPLLPRRLAYPQFVPPERAEANLYRDEDELLAKLNWALTHVDDVRPTSLRAAVAEYDWRLMAPRYDEALEALVGQCAPRR
jgi:glycosyltransferase involved in cell wall biosynthesis